MVGKKAKNKAVGISKGGNNTKIHTLVDGLGNPLAFLLSPGNDHDSEHAIPLLSQIKIEGSNILGDKAYGAKAIREYIITPANKQFELHQFIAIYDGMVKIGFHMIRISR